MCPLSQRDELVYLSLTRPDLDASFVRVAVTNLHINEKVHIDRKTPSERIFTTVAGFVS